jgi:hypothetical protein
MGVMGILIMVYSRRRIMRRYSVVGLEDLKAVQPMALLELFGIRKWRRIFGACKFPVESKGLQKFDLFIH